MLYNYVARNEYHTAVTLEQHLKRDASGEIYRSYRCIVQRQGKKVRVYRISRYSYYRMIRLAQTEITLRDVKIRDNLFQDHIRFFTPREGFIK